MNTLMISSDAVGTIKMLNIRACSSMFTVLTYRKPDLRATLTILWIPSPITQMINEY